MFDHALDPTLETDPNNPVSLTFSVATRAADEAVDAAVELILTTFSLATEAHLPAFNVKLERLF